MTNVQKACCILLCLCMAGIFVLYSPGFQNFRQGPDFLWNKLPLYRFLEEQSVYSPQTEDPETYEKIVKANEAYLNTQVMGENEGAVKKEEEEETEAEEETETASAGNNLLAPVAETPCPVLDLSPEKLADYDYLLNQFFIVDTNTSADSQNLNAAAFMEKDLTLEKDASQPQILIYHSHSQEFFADSDTSNPEDGVVGMGNYLTQLLTEQYGYQVLHVTEQFDVVDGQIDRNRAYDYAREYVEPLLEEHPSIEVVLDLHRDGVPEDRRLVTEINGKPTAQIMFYNGLSYTVNNGPVDYLPNPYIQDNLAFSFQLEMQAAQYYPDFYRGIYLSGLRYNLHLRPRALLLEVGAQTNTVEEVRNAMEPFADILNKVLSGE